MTCPSMSVCPISYTLTYVRSDDSWRDFLKRFAGSVQHITGQVLDVRPALDGNELQLEDEVERLRAKVDELSEEVTTCCGLAM